MITHQTIKLAEVVTRKHKEKEHNRLTDQSGTGDSSKEAETERNPVNLEYSGYVLQVNFRVCISNGFRMISGMDFMGQRSGDEVNQRNFAARFLVSEEEFGRIVRTWRQMELNQ
ncbi:hypothetical protein RYX36_007124 [Vicia faba]